MKDRINIGIVGLGARGFSLSKFIARMKDINILYLCDLYQDRVDLALQTINKITKTNPSGTLNYKDILSDPRIDAVLVFSSWDSHSKIALEAMQAGKYVGIEVGGAQDLKECWDIVDTFEKTGSQIMMLENCCYGKYELMVKNMVKEGIFGEVVHCSGGYHHDLRKEISYGRENRHYRLKNYILNNCDNYPTHELGPIAKILNINNGNLMESLFSSSSKSLGLHQYILDNKSNDLDLLNTSFSQGDIVTTVITCKNGETIVLTLDTTLPRFYSRGFTVRGTKAMYQEEGNILFIDKLHDFAKECPKCLYGNGKKYLKKYMHPIWKNFKKEGIKGGHGGMDYLVLRAFFEAVKNGTSTPIDAYDTASWMAITALSKESIRIKSPLLIPDFTRGKWENRQKSNGIFAID